MGIFDNLLKKEDEEENILMESKPNENCIFSAYEGGYFGPSYYYYIDYINGHYHFKFGYSESGKMIDEKELSTLIEKEECYIEFIDKLGDVIKGWKKEYIDNSVLDGVQWNIKDFKNNIYIFGSNEFPEDYNKLCDLLKQYFDVEDYMKKINKYNIEPEENVVQFVYGVPDWETIKLNDEIEKEKDKYNVKPEENIPYEVYGVPDSIKKKLVNKEKINLIKVNINDKDYNYTITLDKKMNDVTKNYEANISFTNDETEGSSVKIPLNEYDNYIDRLLDIVDNWDDETNNKMLERTNFSIEWKLDIYESEDIITYNNVDKVPSNWNKFIDLLSEVELIFKSDIKKDSENK